MAITTVCIHKTDACVGLIWTKTDCHQMNFNTYVFLNDDGWTPVLQYFISVLSLQDNTNIDAAIACLVKNIMSLEEERASSDAAAAAKTEAEGSVLVLPRFDYNVKEKGLGGCSGCPSLKPRDRDND